MIDKNIYIVSDSIDMDDGDGSRNLSLNFGYKIFFLRAFFQRMERTFVKSLHTIQRVRMKIGAARLRWGDGDAQRSILYVNEFKKTGERSARARSADKTH